MYPGLLCKMNEELKVVLYTQDQEVISLFQGLLESEGSVFVAQEGDLLLGHLVHIIDWSFPKRNFILDALSDYEGLIVCLLTANPFAISMVREYNVDAILSKPLQAEAVQALLVGIRARLAL